MRCPYCGGFNKDSAASCKSCGRDLSVAPVSAPQRQPPLRPPYQSPQPPRSVTPVQAPPYRPPAAPSPQSAPVSSPTQRRADMDMSRRQVPDSDPPTPVISQGSEPPVPFPPRSIEQARLLEQGALRYALVTNDVSNGRQQILRIAYPRCAGWQQVATLLKAFRDHQSEKYERVIIQGVQEQESSVYNYTNGQLAFDRKVRLGSQELNRYQIETENGFSSDSVRIVLSE